MLPFMVLVLVLLLLLRLLLLLLVLVLVLVLLLWLRWLCCCCFRFTLGLQIICSSSTNEGFVGFCARKKPVGLYVKPLGSCWKCISSNVQMFLE